MNTMMRTVMLNISCTAKVNIVQHNRKVRNSLKNHHKRKQNE